MARPANPYGDGHASRRIRQALAYHFGRGKTGRRSSTRNGWYARREGDRRGGPTRYLLQWGMRVGTLSIDPPVALGPMAGITDLAFRLLCKEAGAGLVYTGMISANAYHYGSERTEDLMVFAEAERPVCAQVFGANPEIVARAAAAAEARGADLVDLNMGCAVPEGIEGALRRLAHGRPGTGGSDGARGGRRGARAGGRQDTHGLARPGGAGGGFCAAVRARGGLAARGAPAGGRSAIPRACGVERHCGSEVRGGGPCSGKWGYHASGRCGAYGRRDRMRWRDDRARRAGQSLDLRAGRRGPPGPTRSPSPHAGGAARRGTPSPGTHPRRPWGRNWRAGNAQAFFLVYARPPRRPRAAATWPTARRRKKGCSRSSGPRGKTPETVTP